MEPVRRKPGPDPRISREDVVAAARRLGARDRLTMTALSAELGVSIATLYNYVPDKAGVIGLLAMEDRDVIEAPDPSLSWREWIKSAIQSERAFLDSHVNLPVTAALVAARRPAGRMLQEGLAVLTRAGFTPMDALLAVTVASQTALALHLSVRMALEPIDPELAADTVETVEMLASYGIDLDYAAISAGLIELILDGIATRLTDASERTKAKTRRARR